MDRHRGERHGGDRLGGDRMGGGRGGGGGDLPPRRMPSSRWSDDGPANDHHRFPRGGGGGGGGRGGGFGGGEGRFHPYRGPQDYPTGGGGGPGFRGGPGGFQVPMGGPKRGFLGRGGGSPGSVLALARVSLFFVCVILSFRVRVY